MFLDLFSVIAKKLIETRPCLATEENKNACTPLAMAVLWDKIDVLRVFLEYDFSLGYQVNTEGIPLLNLAAYRGIVGVAEELLNHCPDAPCWNAINGQTCLREAVLSGHENFVEFILRAPQFRKIVNMGDSKGDTALHHAVQMCNPKMVSALLLHQDIDVTVLNNVGDTATWKLSGVTDHAKTLNWVRMFSPFVGPLKTLWTRCTSGLPYSAPSVHYALLDF